VEARGAMLDPILGTPGLLPAIPAIFLGQLLVFPFPTKLSCLCSGHLQGLAS